MRKDRDGTLSFSTSSSILSNTRIGSVVVMLAILLDLFPSISMAFSEVGIGQRGDVAVAAQETVGAV
jgi:hypothetical protein